MSLDPEATPRVYVQAMKFSTVYRTAAIVNLYPGIILTLELMETLQVPETKREDAIAAAYMLGLLYKNNPHRHKDTSDDVDVLGALTSIMGVDYPGVMEAALLCVCPDGIPDEYSSRYGSGTLGVVADLRTDALPLSGKAQSIRCLYMIVETEKWYGHTGERSRLDDMAETANKMTLAHPNALAMLRSAISKRTQELTSQAT